MLVRTRSNAEQGDGSGGECLSGSGSGDIDDSTVSGAGVSTLSSKPIGMDHWNSDSGITNQIYRSKADARVREGHSNTLTLQNPVMLLTLMNCI